MTASFLRAFAPTETAMIDPYTPITYTMSEVYASERRQEAAQVNAYSARLDAQHFAAIEREGRITEIRDAVTKAWLEGSSDHIPTFMGEAETLAQIISEQCYDQPDSPLSGMLLVVAAAARGEDARELANAIINRFALDHATRVVEAA